MIASAASAPLLPDLPPARSSACSMLSVVGAKADRKAVIQRDLHQAIGGAAGHVIEMRGVAANHATERDDGCIATAGRDLVRSQRQLEGAGYADQAQVCVLDTMAQQSVARHTMRRLTTRSLKREAKIAMRPTGVLKSPSMRSMPSIHPYQGGESLPGLYGCPLSGPSHLTAQPTRAQPVGVTIARPADERLAAVPPMQSHRKATPVCISKSC